MFYKPISVREAVQNINETWFLPAIQRPYDWGERNKKEHFIYKLFDSLLRRYPIGTLIIWQTKKPIPFRDFLKDYDTEKLEKIKDKGLWTNPNKNLVYDGQQRLTSIYVGLKGSYAYKKPRVWLEDTEYAIPTRHLYLNILESLTDQEDGRIYEFKFLTEEEYNENPIKWFKVGKILELRNNYGFNKFLDENHYKDNEFTYETLSRLQEVIHTERIINYFLEKEQNIDKALNIFIRINSGGLPLNFSDLLMSIAVANWSEKDARKEIHKLVDEIRDKGFFIDKNFILKAFLLLYSSDIRFKVTNFSKDNAKNFEKEWEKICLTIHRTFDLIKDFGFVESTLTSKNALLPIVYYLYHKNVADGFLSKKEFEEDRKLIKKWLHIVLIKRIFGGQADQILARIRTVFTDDVSKEVIKQEITHFPFVTIQDKLKGTTKDITIDDEFIDNLLKEQKDSGLTFSILALLYSHLDYKNGNFHKDHLHPESSFTLKTLKESGIAEDKLSIYYDAENYNSILNLQLLDGNENESKRKITLKEWVIDESKKQNISIEKFCENHLIPLTLEFNQFPEFVKKRKELLKLKLKEIIN